MKISGKSEKAKKLFDHAVYLSPYNPDILIPYGEFLEEENDVIGADSLYTKTLITNPSNRRVNTSNIYYEIKIWARISLII